MKRYALYFIIWMVYLAAGTGCVRMGPDYRSPQLNVRIPDTYQSDEAGMMINDGVGNRWWEAFDDPDLNRFVEDALANNLDIQKAALRVLEMQSYWIQTRADKLPTVNLQGQNVKQHQSYITDTTSLSFPVSYELDFWGRVSRLTEAAQADLLQTEESRRLVCQTVIAQTIGLYLQIESLERRIQITRQSIDNYRKSLRFVEKRYERGLVSILDVYQARRVLAQAEASLPSLRQDLGASQQQLSVLLGRYPEMSSPRRHPADYYRPLPPVPAGLPSDLLMQRPDIRAAEAQLKGLNARVGAAKANRFPRISLTGSFGYSSSELEDLFTSESELWSLVQGITLPLFNSGKTKAGQRIAEARYQQGLTDYAKTVLTAFQEVETALLARKEQIERRELVLKLLKEARATQKIAQSRYEKGLTTYLTVLDAQQALYKSEESLVLVDLAILSNRVSLHRALGGGWGGGTDHKQLNAMADQDRGRV